MFHTCVKRYSWWFLAMMVSQPSVVMVGRPNGSRQPCSATQSQLVSADRSKHSPMSHLSRRRLLEHGQKGCPALTHLGEFDKPQRIFPVVKGGGAARALFRLSAARKQGNRRRRSSMREIENQHDIVQQQRLPTSTWYGVHFSQWSRGERQELTDGLGVALALCPSGTFSNVSEAATCRVVECHNSSH